MTNTEKRRKNLERLRERIEDSEDLNEEDREALLEFDDKLALLKSEYGVHRHEKLLRHCTIIAENTGKLCESLGSQDVAEDVVRWINREYENEETNRDYRAALRVFGKRVTDGDEVPESLEWIPTTTSKNYEPKPDPSEMLDWEEDVVPMINETNNDRDAAFIAVAWDSGARASELFNLTVGDVEDHRHGFRITLDGKTGQRSITLVLSVPYLTRWLDSHPARDDRNAPLWTKLGKNSGVSYQAMRDRVRRAARKAEVRKPVNFTNFRKSCASYLASEGMSQAHLEERMGWERGSDVASRYVSVFGEQSELEFAKIHGIDVSEEENEPLGPVECPRCDKETPREEDFCVWCGQALEPGAMDEIKQEERELRSAVMRLVKEDPELIDDIQATQDLIAVIEDNPKLMEDAQDFVDSLKS